MHYSYNSKIFCIISFLIFEIHQYLRNLIKLLENIYSEISMFGKILVLCLSVLVILITFILLILYIPELGTQTSTESEFTKYYPIIIALVIPFILPRNNNKLVSNVNSTRLDLQFI